MAERSRVLDSSSGVVRMWVRIPAWPVAALVSLSKTLNHNCFVLRMGRKAVGPVCCVLHIKEPRALIVKEKGLALVFLEWQQNASKLFTPLNRLSLDRWRIINVIQVIYDCKKKKIKNSFLGQRLRNRWIVLNLKVRMRAWRHARPNPPLSGF